MDDGERSGHSRSLCLADHRHPRSLVGLFLSLLTSSLYTPYPPEAPLRGSDGVTRRRSETRNDGPRREAATDRHSRWSFLSVSFSLPHPHSPRVRPKAARSAGETRGEWRMSGKGRVRNER